MEFRKIKYPCDANEEVDNNWFTFGEDEGSVDINNQEIEIWANEVINDIKKQLENNVENPYSLRASGNTIVIGLFSQDIHDDVWNDNNYITIMVAKNYKQGDFFIGDLRKKNTNKEKDSFIKVELNNDYDLQNLIKDFDIFIKRKGI